MRRLAPIYMSAACLLTITRVSTFQITNNQLQQTSYRLPNRLYHTRCTKPVDIHPSTTQHHDVEKTIEPAIHWHRPLNAIITTTTTITLLSPLPSQASTLVSSLPTFPYLPLSTYLLLSLSGALACCITHITVVPIDVIKTRRQTTLPSSPPPKTLSIWDGSLPTALGYTYYGLTVYPTYNLLLRYFLTLPLPVLSTLPSTTPSFLAGSCAAVVACIGLAPTEVWRIRVVAEPERYKGMGIRGVFKGISSGGKGTGWESLYAGWWPLLIRQVSFGTVKFAFFDYLLTVILESGRLGWTAKGGWEASLFAGVGAGIAGAIVSQPSDAVLTWLACNESTSVGVVQGFKELVDKKGKKALAKGIEERIVWAALIIGIQFAIYDGLRELVGVSDADIRMIVQAANNAVVDGELMAIGGG